MNCGDRANPSSITTHMSQHNNNWWLPAAAIALFKMITTEAHLVTSILRPTTWIFKYQQRECFELGAVKNFERLGRTTHHKANTLAAYHMRRCNAPKCCIRAALCCPSHLENEIHRGSISSHNQILTIRLKCLYNSTIQYINNSKILLKFIMALSQIGVAQTFKTRN